MHDMFHGSEGEKGGVCTICSMVLRVRRRGGGVCTICSMVLRVRRRGGGDARYVPWF